MRAFSAASIPFVTLLATTTSFAATTGNHATDAIARAGTKLQQAQPAVQFRLDNGRIERIYGAPLTFGETPTAGYSLLKLFAAYSLQREAAMHTLTARVDNATNELYRNHLNYLKDLVPEAGRNFRLVYAVTF